MNIRMPYICEIVLNMLFKSGYKAYIVGGCVRDSLLGMEPHDWDITTSATPEQVKEIFKDKFNIIDTGLQHGTVTITINYAMDNSNIYQVEVTTFRNDGDYSDNRHPNNVNFVSTLEEDLSRRDFVINAMAYNKEEGFIDLFNGIKDLKNGIIRCVGNTNNRYSEDSLRMLRAIRFSAQLGFDIDIDTFTAIINNAPKIQNVSSERIMMELNKILLSDHPEHIKILYASGLMQYIIPELCDCINIEQNNTYHIYDVGNHIIESLQHIESNLVLRLTMLLHDIGKPICKTTDQKKDHFYNHSEVGSTMSIEILKRLRYDNYTIMRVRDLILYHDCEIQDNRKSVRKWLNKIGEETFRQLLKIKEADIKAQNPIYYEERHNKIQRIKVLLDEVIKDSECFSRKDLAINGNDLIRLGCREGKEIGGVLDILLSMVIDDPNMNTKEKLEEYACNNLIK